MFLVWEYHFLFTLISSTHLGRKTRLRFFLMLFEGIMCSYLWKILRFVVSTFKRRTKLLILTKYCDHYAIKIECIFMLLNYIRMAK